MDLGKTTRYKGKGGGAIKRHELLGEMKRLRFDLEQGVEATMRVLGKETGDGECALTENGVDSQKNSMEIMEYKGAS